MAETLTDGRQISLATETERGASEKATTTEINTGTNDINYVTPKGVNDRYKDNYISSQTSAALSENGSDVLTTPADCNIILLEEINRGVHVTLTRAGKNTATLSTVAGTASWSTGTNQLTVAADNSVGTYQYRAYYYVTL